MDESALVAAIEQHESDSVRHGLFDAEIQEALDRYHGEPMGNEVAGRSQVVSRDSFDTVEWLKPQLADIFTSGEEIIAFSPRGPEDVPSAAQETDYVNHVIMQRNEWFEVWYSWTHDALTQKVGYVKAFWDDSKDKTREKYQNLDQNQFARLQQDDEIEFIAQAQEPVLGPDGMPLIGPDGQPAMSWSCEVERVKARDTVCIENIPPENIRVDKNARRLSLQDRRLAFVEHTEMMTISDLRNDGLDVPDDIGDADGAAGDMERLRRDDPADWDERDGVETDPSMRRVRVRECWIRCDYDGDGRAELRHVIVVGTTVLLNEDADCVPIVALCPIPQPHKHKGMSIIDAVLDLERIQTALLRGALDSQALANNGRYGINENNVNLDDMLDSRSGGLVRVDGEPGANLFPLTHPTDGARVVPMMEYIDRLKERRTGISEQTQGLNPQALNNQAGASANAALLSASQQRIKFIARIFAETGVKTLFQIVHQLTLQNSRKEDVVELRGQWVPVNPRHWVKRNDMVISVALGAGDRVQQLAYLGQQRMMQLEMLPLGLAKPENLYATVSRMTKAAGYKDADEFWTDPSKNPPPPPQPPLEIQLEQLKQQGEMQKTQMLQQAEAMKFQAEHQMNAAIERLKAEAKQREVELQLQLQASNDMRDGERETFKAEKQAQLAQAQLDVQLATESARAELEKYKADLDAQVKLQIAGMNQQTTLETASLSARTSLEQTDKSTAAAAEAKKPAKPDTSMMDAINKLSEKVDRVEKHNSAPRKKVRDASGKLIAVEINGVKVPIED